MPQHFRRRLLIQMAQALVLMSICFCFLSAMALAHHSFTWSDFANILVIRITIGNLLLFLGFLGFCGLVVSGPAGFYRSHRISSLSRRCSETLLAAGLITLIFLPLRQPMHLEFATNIFLGTFFLLSLATLFLSREFCLWLLRLARFRGRNLRNISIVAESKDAPSLAAFLGRERQLGYRISHLIVPTASSQNSTREGIVERTASLIDKEAVDELLLALPPNRYRKEIERILELCEEQGILVRLKATDYHPRLGSLRLDELDGAPFLAIQPGPSDEWGLIAKRVIDLLGSLVLLLILTPWLALLAALIKMDSPGPVFYRQKRIGRNKRSFSLLKFRTMVENAEARQASLDPLNEMGGPVFKIKQDPRVTRVGTILRRFSLDELPQLINVLKGEMSLVGPRPLPIRDVRGIEKSWQKRRFSVRPGLTCLWQVGGRSNINFDRWIELDLEYIDRWSLGLDFKILLQTIPAVLKGSGAY